MLDFSVIRWCDRCKLIRSRKGAHNSPDIFASFSYLSGVIAVLWIVQLVREGKLGCCFFIVNYSIGSQIQSKYSGHSLSLKNVRSRRTHNSLATQKKLFARCHSTGRYTQF